MTNEILNSEMMNEEQLEQVAGGDAYDDYVKEMKEREEEDRRNGKDPTTEHLKRYKEAWKRANN